MGADSVLVDAAFKEATSRAGANVPNMKPLYDSNVSSMNKAFDTINSAMGVYSAKKEVGRAGVRKQMAGFQAQADALVKGMYAQDEPLPDVFVNAFREKITSLQDEFELYNTYGKGDTSENSQARSRIMGELKRVTNQATNFRAGIEIALDNLKDVDPGSLDKRNIAAHMQAFNFENYEQLVADGKIRVVYGKNGIEIIAKDYNTIIDNVGTGEYTEEVGIDGNIMGSEITRQVESFGGKEVVITLASFNENFKPVDLKGHVALGEDILNSTKSATDAGSKQNAEYDYNEQEYNALFTSHVDTEDKFRNFSTSKIKGLHEIKESFKVSLENELNIPIATLSNMVIDLDGDGINDMETILKELNIAGGNDIDAEDLAKGQGNALFEQNLDSLIDALTEVSHPAFDIGLSAPMLGAYLGKINQNRYKTAFDKAKKANAPKGSGGDAFKFNVNQGYNMIVPGSDGTRRKEYVSGQLIATAQDFINTPIEGSVLEGYDGNIYRVKDGKFMQGENIVTQSRISKNLGMWSYGYKPKDTYEVAADPIYEPSTYKINNYFVGKKRYSTVGEAVGMWERQFKKKNPNASKQEIADAVAAERILMERAQ